MLIDFLSSHSGLRKDSSSRLYFSLCFDLVLFLTYICLSPKGIERLSRPAMTYDSKMVISGLISKQTKR